MVIITEATYPPASAKDAGKCFKELPPLPDYITMRGPYIQSATGAGIRGMVVYECDRSRLAEAIEVIGDRITKYFDVPGYTYSMDVWLEAQEALKLVGLA